MIPGERNLQMKGAREGGSHRRKEKSQRARENGKRKKGGVLALEPERPGRRLRRGRLGRVGVLKRKAGGGKREGGSQERGKGKREDG